MTGPKPGRRFPLRLPVFTSMKFFLKPHSHDLS